MSTASYDQLTKEQLVELLLERDRDTESNPHRKKYGLIWEEKPEQFEADSIGRIPVLQRDSAKCIFTSPDRPTHVLIQGDNYHALKVLTYTHERSVDVIYIDPPYNTGNKDFVYWDDFKEKRTVVEKEDGFRHSKWLSFMAKRLRLAKALMKDDGVIFLSIDDNEVAQLKLLCDEVFGEDGFLGIVTWVKRTKPINSGKARLQLQSSVEYVLAYSKCRSAKFPGFRLLVEGERRYGQVDKNGRSCRTVDLEDSDKGRKARDTMKFPILGVLPGDGKRWKLGQAEANRLCSDGHIQLFEGKPKRCIFPGEEPPGIERPFWSHIPLEVTGTAETGKSELRDVVGPDHGFDTVKPLGLMKQILSHFSSDILVLDFFAGSGTTAHAVMALNAEDGGNRRCILATNDEGVFKDSAGAQRAGGICSNVTLPRLRGALQGYVDHSGAPIAGADENLAFFETKFVEDRALERYRRDLSARSAEMLCLREACYEEETATDKRWRAFTDGKGKRLVVVSDEFAAEDLVPLLKADKRETVVYVFRFGDDEDPAREYGGKGLEHVTAKPVPDSLLALHRRIQKQEVKAV